MFKNLTINFNSHIKMAEKRKNGEHLSSVMYTCSWCLVQKVWVLKLVSHHFQWCQTKLFLHTCVHQYIKYIERDPFITGCLIAEWLDQCFSAYCTMQCTITRSAYCTIRDYNKQNSTIMFWPLNSHQSWSKCSKSSIKC